MVIIQLVVMSSIRHLQSEISIRDKTEFLFVTSVMEVNYLLYSQLSLSGHLSKADTSVRRTENLVPAEFHLFLCN